MTYEEYRKAYFTSPEPEQRYAFRGFGGISIYYGEYEEAVAFYTSVFGPPAYVEEEEVTGWPVGGGWLSVFNGESGTPGNVEITLWCKTREAVDEIRAAFLAAGGTAEEPEETHMYDPVYLCIAEDPFGVSFLITARLS